MSFITFKSITYALIAILLIHLIIQFIQKNNNKEVEKIEVFNNSDCQDDYQRSKKKTKEDVDKKSNQVNNNNLSEIKDDLKSFLDNNDIFLKSNDDNYQPQDKQIQFADSQIDNQKTEIDKFFETNNLDKEIKQDYKKFKEPTVNLSNKKKMEVDLNDPNFGNNQIWKYDNEDIMNGGEFQKGVTGWDNTTNSDFSLIK